MQRFETYNINGAPLAVVEANNYAAAARKGLLKAFPEFVSTRNIALEEVVVPEHLTFKNAPRHFDVCVVGARSRKYFVIV